MDSCEPAVFLRAHPVVAASMDLTNNVGGIEKLNNSNYDYWKSCLESYLQGQDLWEVVNGADVTPPNGTAETQDASRKWKIKAGKALFSQGYNSEGYAGAYS